MGFVREVDMGIGPIQPLGSRVISNGSFTGRVEGAQPDAAATVGLANLRNPLAPRPLADAFIGARSVLGPTFPSHATFSRARLSRPPATAAAIVSDVQHSG